MQIAYGTHEQAMACMTCGLAGETPDYAFPQDPGLWENPCPGCGELSVWVTEIRKREVSEEDGV